MYRRGIRCVDPRISRNVFQCMILSYFRRIAPPENSQVPTGREITAEKPPQFMLVEGADTGGFQGYEPSFTVFLSFFFPFCKKVDLDQPPFHTAGSTWARWMNMQHIGHAR